MTRWLAGGFFLAACLAYLPGHDPWSIRWVALAGLACLAVTVREWPRAVLPAGLLAGWAALSLLWSPDPFQGLDSLWRVLVAMLAAVAMLEAHWKPRLGAIAFCGAVALGLFDPSTFGGFGNENWQAEFLLISAPWFIGLFSKAQWRLFTIWAVLICCIPIAGYLLIWGAGNGSLSWLVVLGADIWLLAFWLASRRQWAYALILILLPLALLPEAWPSIKASLLERGEIWINTAVLWWEKPFFGHGLGFFAHEYPRVQAAHLELLPGTFMSSPTYMVFQAHSEPLEMLATFGLVGASIAGWLVYTIVRGLRWPFSPALAARLSLWHLLVLSLISFPLQNPSTLALGCLALGAVLKPAWWAWGWSRGVVLATALTASAVSGVAYAGGTYFTASRAMAERGGATLDALLLTRESVGIYPLRAWPRMMLALRLRSLLMQHKGKIRLDNEAADKLHAQSFSASPYAPFVIIPRLEYLWYTRRNPEEAEMLLARLKEVAPGQPTTLAAVAIAERLK